MLGRGLSGATDPRHFIAAIAARAGGPCFCLALAKPRLEHDETSLGRLHDRFGSTLYIKLRKYRGYVKLRRGE